MRVQVCLGPGEGTLVTGGYDQAVRVWDMRSRSFDAIQTIKSFADSVTSVAVSARSVPSPLVLCSWRPLLLTDHLETPTDTYRSPIWLEKFITGIYLRAFKKTLDTVFCQTAEIYLGHTVPDLVSMLNRQAPHHMCW